MLLFVVVCCLLSLVGCWLFVVIRCIDRLCVVALLVVRRRRSLFVVCCLMLDISLLWFV